jgi:hypothetical protein
MILFPSKFFIARLQRGSVIRFSHPRFPGKPHYFIVLNNNPSRDRFLLFVTSTTNTDRIKRMIDRQKHLAGGYVFVKTGEYECFDRDSYINCHKAYPFEIGKLKKIYERGLVELKDSLPQKLTDKVLEGCLASPMFKPKYRKFLSS